MSQIIAQKIHKEYSKTIDLAIVYYQILSDLNKLDLSKREIELLAHTAVRGVISSITSKEEYIKKFGSSKATVNNMISKLTRMGLLTKTDSKIEVNKQICPDFSKKNMVLQLNLKVND